jgi:CheY-like chemotaxis protein
VASRAVEGLCILVVEDSVDAAEALRMLLEAIGHTGLVAHTGAEALAVARARRPDLILLDLALPDISGFEVARQLREDRTFDATRLVALSGFGADEHRQRCAEGGFDDCLEKPVELGVLLTALDDCRRAT